MQSLQTTLFIQLIIWQFANLTALQNVQSATISEKQDAGIVDVTNTSFYPYEPETFLKNQSARMMYQPRVLTEKPEIETNNERSVEKLQQQLMKLNNKPVVLLVDETESAFKDALFFTESFFQVPTLRTEFWLMVFNASGVSTISAQSRSNPKEIISQLKKHKTEIKNVKNEGSAMFFSILKASQILPRESAIILFTGRNSIDEDLAQLSVNYLTSKFITLNVVWGGILPSKGREEKLLEDAVAYTQGLFLLGNIANNNNIKTQQDFMGTKEIIVFKKHLHNQQTIPIPIDGSLRNIDIVIEGEIASAILSTPTGTGVDLLDGTSVRRLFSTSAEVDASTAHDRNRWVSLRFNTAKVTTTPVIGIWYLRVTGLQKQSHRNGYNVTVYADTEICIQSDITRGTPKNKEIHLKFNGDISKIENISFIDSSGQEIKTIRNEATFKNQLNLTENIKQDSFYVKITGTNNNGEKFSRLSYANQNNIDTRRIPRILIEVDARSDLLVAPGSYGKIIFHVTNNYEYPLVRLPFSVQDEKRMLKSLYPEYANIGSKQSAEITVMTTVPPSTSVDFTNQITFTAYATERAQKIAIMYVTSNRLRDDHLPTIDYKFNSNCMEVPQGSCQNTYWTIELTAQDSQSGLMQVLSIPSGIYSPTGYMSGTKEPIHFYYTANCCQPETEIIAIDLSGNRRSFRVDANHANLSAGAIAAIVLGALIILAIIILIIVLVTKKCRQRDSLDLPRYRGQATSSTRF